MTSLANSGSVERKAAPAERKKGPSDEPKTQKKGLRPRTGRASTVLSERDTLG